jgi:hypothetical protein
MPTFRRREGVRDPNTLVVGGQPDEGKTDEELEDAQDSEERERRELIEAWEAMYRRKGIDPTSYHIDWDAIFAGERGE